MKLIVYHSYYGCATGCCGHTIKDEDDGTEDFRFTHPYGDDFKEFAKNLVRVEYGEEHVKDLDWENCIINDD